MKITWLGQAGLMIDTAGKIIIVDPYLSDSVGRKNPKKSRRQPIDEGFLSVKPDYILCTHNHLDHTDPETLSHYLSEDGEITVLAPGEAWNEARKFGGEHNYVLFERHSEWSDGELRFIAVKADHSDPQAIGFIIEAEGKRLYITGDTLYNSEIFSDITPLGKIDALFLPINGVGNNMNMQDAARFAKKVGAEKTVPLHFGLFDSLSPMDFRCENRVIPEIFKEIKLD